MYLYIYIYPNLVDKLLHACLQTPDFELDCDQFVGAHDGVLAVDPSLLEEASAGLLGLEVPQVLGGHDTPEKNK